MQYNIYNLLNAVCVCVCVRARARVCFNPPSLYKSSSVWTCPSGTTNTCCSHTPVLGSAEPLLTYKQIPLGVEISLICQAALHDIEAVVVAWSHRGESPTVRAVQHLHERTDAAWGRAHLEID